jgi:hypothetical protein
VISAWATINATASTADGDGAGDGAGYTAFRVFLSFWDNPHAVGPSANRTVTVNVNGSSAPGLAQRIASGAATVSQWRIDSTHANPQQLWKDMGSPTVAAITDAQLQQLQVASAIKAEPLALLTSTTCYSEGVRASASGDAVTVTVHMPSNSAVVLVFE